MGEKVRQTENEKRECETLREKKKQRTRDKTGETGTPDVAAKEKLR